MTSPFLGQIQPFGFNFAPRGWAACNGQLLSISQNTALFSLLGTFYGGNGTSNFALPNLQSSVPLGMGQGTALSPYDLGEAGGVEGVTLLSAEMPSHNHTFSGTTAAANDKAPVAGAALATSTAPGPVSPASSYYSANNQAGTSINLNTVARYVGQGLAHTNIQPYLTLNFCIAMQGIYPARN